MPHTLLYSLMLSVLVFMVVTLKIIIVTCDYFDWPVLVALFTSSVT